MLSISDGRLGLGALLVVNVWTQIFHYLYDTFQNHTSQYMSIVNMELFLT